MTGRYLMVLILLASTGVGRAAEQEGFTVSVCFAHTPTGSCSEREQLYGHSLSLEGPIPFGGLRPPDRHQLGAPYRFFDVRPGGYIVRTAGCNPFGCWMDMAIAVVDRDVSVTVQQVEGQPLTPRPSPTATPTAAPCVGDANEDERVTIDELVGAVANAIGGCRD